MFRYVAKVPTKWTGWMDLDTIMFPIFTAHGAWMNIESYCTVATNLLVSDPSSLPSTSRNNFQFQYLTKTFL